MAEPVVIAHVSSAVALESFLCRKLFTAFPAEQVPFLRVIIAPLAVHRFLKATILYKVICAEKALKKRFGKVLWENFKYLS
jgi:hypothetical protein